MEEPRKEVGFHKSAGARWMGLCQSAPEQQRQIYLSSLGTDPDTALYLGKQFLEGGECCAFGS